MKRFLVFIHDDDALGGLLDAKQFFDEVNEAIAFASQEAEELGIGDNGFWHILDLMTGKVYHPGFPGCQSVSKVEIDDAGLEWVELSKSFDRVEV